MRFARQTSLVTAITLLWVTSPASAFTVSSGFTRGCHEEITWAAFQGFLLELPVMGIPVSEDAVWRELANFLLEEGPVDPDTVDETKRFFLVSLIVGVRSPDTDGHSVTNLAQLRQLHSDPSPVGQYAHSLRGKDDDDAEGNKRAIQGIEDLIADELRRSDEYLRKPPDEQIILGSFYLDYYGRIDVDVWGPMYHLGRAAHALQDSFAHTIRSDADNLRKITHILNYLEAIGSDFDENRDGLAHSDSMDDCSDADTEDTFNAAVEATVDLFYVARERWNATDPNALDHLVDKWLTLKPDCTLENSFCDNARWLTQVRKKQTGPYFKAIFGCQISEGTSSSTPLWLVMGLLIVLGLFRRRQRFDPHQMR